MKLFLLMIFSFLVGGVSIAAQSNAAPLDLCVSNPRLKVSTDLPTRGEAFAVEAEFDRTNEKFKTDNLNFVWTISNAEILGGQGTPKINLMQTVANQNFTAALEITKANCAKVSLSVSMFICSPLKAVLFDQLVILKNTKDTKARLDNAVAELRKNPGGRISVGICTNKKFGRAYVNRQIEIVFSYLVGNKKVTAAEIEFAAAECQSANTFVWIVPQGAELPLTEVRGLIEDETLKFSAIQPEPNRKR